MRGLIILQPHAGLFAARLKVNAAGETIEFRNRETHVRGQVAIRAGMDQTWLALLTHHANKATIDLILDAQALSPAICNTYGGILCLATLADCRPVETADVTCPGCPDRASEEWMTTWAWVFTDLRALPEPVVYKPPRGAQTWFHLPEDVQAEVTRQTAREGREDSDGRPDLPDLRELPTS